MDTTYWRRRRRLFGWTAIALAVTGIAVQVLLPVSDNWGWMLAAIAALCYHVHGYAQGQDRGEQRGYRAGRQDAHQAILTAATVRANPEVTTGEPLGLRDEFHVEGMLDAAHVAIHGLASDPAGRR